MYIREDHFQRNNNNFDALRLAAAMGVFVSHGCGFNQVKMEEPLFALTGKYYLSSIGLIIFFTLSGFLVCRSLTRSTVKDYLWNRLLRISPAIAVCSLLTILVTGCLFTSLPLRDFFLHSQTWYFLVQNAIPFRVVFALPGVFDGKSVNLSLWTIPIEIKMYGALLLTYLLQLFSKRLLFAGAWILLIITKVFFVRILTDLSGYSELYTMLYFATYFFGGAVFYLFRDKLHINLAIWIVLLTGWLLTWKFFPDYLGTAELFFFIYTIIGIGVSTVRIPFPAADISYGFYLYGFPVQRTVFYAWGMKLAFWQFGLLTFGLTLALATASWFLVEKKALSLKKHRRVVSAEQLIAEPENKAHQYKQEA